MIGASKYTVINALFLILINKKFLKLFILLVRRKKETLYIIVSQVNLI